MFPVSFVRNLRRGALLVCILLQSLGASSFAQAPAPERPPADGADIQRVIRDYILAHPEVLIESLQREKARREEAAAAQTKTLIRSLGKQLVDDADSPVFGNPNGDVTIVEFFDYRCPYCRQIEPILQGLIKDDPSLRIVQKELPILGPVSVYAARAALAANKQGKLATLHAALMAQRPNFDEASVLRIAESAGIDMDRLKADMASPEVNGEIGSSQQLAGVLKLNGTPAFIIGTELLPGVVDRETLQSLVNYARHSSG